MDIDFGVVHPLQPSCSLAEVEPGKLARQAARHKKSASTALCRRAGSSFETFIVETFGSWESGALRLAQALVKMTALHRSRSLVEAARSCRSRLAAAVLRGMCRQVERGYPVEGDGAAPAAADTVSV